MPVLDREPGPTVEANPFVREAVEADLPSVEEAYELARLCTLPEAAREIVVPVVLVGSGACVVLLVRLGAVLVSHER